MINTADKETRYGYLLEAADRMTPFGRRKTNTRLLNSRISQLIDVSIAERSSERITSIFGTLCSPHLLLSYYITLTFDIAVNMTFYSSITAFVDAYVALKTINKIKFIYFL